jgi:predicted dienelactone hydrolase
MQVPVIGRRSVLASGLAFSLAGRARAQQSVTVIKAEDGRDVRVTIWPAAGLRRGVILFSHGAMSAPEKYERLMTPWSAAGFEILAPLHIDSTSHPDNAKYPPTASWPARILDMRALSAFVDAPSYVAAGHSYGGLTVLTLGGAMGVMPPGFKGPTRDPRAKSVVAFSPPGTTPKLMEPRGYSSVAVPTFIQTGTRDVPFGDKDGRWQSHLAAYDDAAPGDKYALVLDGVDHYFGSLICEFDKPGPPQTAQLAEAVRLSTLFMDTYGLHDKDARQQLDKAVGNAGFATFTKK